MELVWPTLARLYGVRNALARGWSPDNLRSDAAREELVEIDDDPAGYVAAQVDRTGRGPPIALPGGRFAPRLPGFRRWLWDGEFCGIIGLRWQPGTTDLPAYCLGHIGYAVVPWKRRRGYATRALELILRDARDEGLPFVILTTDLANYPSQRVIEANGGALVDAFHKPPSFGGARSLRYRIDLQETLQRTACNESD